MTLGKWAICLGLATTLPTLSAAEEVWLPQYGTERRERNHDIRSIWHDLRTPSAMVLPGAAPRRNGWVQVGYLGWGLNYEDLDEESWIGWRSEIAAHIHQRIYQNLFIEGRGMIAAGTTEQATISDPWVGLAYYLNQHRYGGLCFTGGYGFPTDDKDLEDSHDADAEDGTWMLGMRLSEGWRFWSFQGNLGVRYFQEGSTKIEDALVTDDGDVIDDGTWLHDQINLQAGFSASYRFSRWFRLGGEAQGEFVQWTGADSGDDRSLQDWRLPAAAFVEARFSETIALQLEGGAELVALADDDANDPWLVSATLVVAY